MATVNASCLLPPPQALSFQTSNCIPGSLATLSSSGVLVPSRQRQELKPPQDRCTRPHGLCTTQLQAAALRGSVSGSREPGLPGALLPAWLTSLTPHGALARVSAPLLSILGLLGPQCLLLLKPQMFLYVNSTDVNASLNL